MNSMELSIVFLVVVCTFYLALVIIDMLEVGGYFARLARRVLRASIGNGKVDLGCVDLDKINRGYQSVPLWQYGVGYRKRIEKKGNDQS